MAENQGNGPEQTRLCEVSAAHAGTTASKTKADGATEQFIREEMARRLQGQLFGVSPSTKTNSWQLLLPSAMPSRNSTAAP